jgi:hypothetical protein
VLAAILVPLNLLHVARIATISPLDELMHIDYLVRGSGPGFLRMSDTFTQEAMDEIACRRHPTQSLPPCGERPYDPEQFSWKGRNLASSHSPWYYVVTGVAARVLRAVLPGDSLVTWGRALGSVWLLAGLAITLQVGRRLGFSPWPLVGFLSLLALSPATQHAATTINPDATCVFAGSIVLLAAVRAMEGSAAVWWALPAATVAVLLDPGNVLVVLAMMLFGVLLAGDRRRTAAVVVALLAAGVVAAEASTRVLVHLLGTVDYTGNPQDALFAVAGLTGPMAWGESAIFALVPPTKGYMFPALSTPAHLVATSAASVLAMTAIVAGAVSSTAARMRRPLFISSFLVLLVGGPLLVGMRYVLGGTYFAIPARYGLCMVPLVGLSGAHVFAARFGRIVVLAVLAAMVATTVYALT